MNRRIRRAKKRGLELGKMVPPGHYQRGTGPHKAHRERAAAKAAALLRKPEKKLKPKAAKTAQAASAPKVETKPKAVSSKTEDISPAAIADTKVNDVSPTPESGEPPDQNDLKSDPVNSQKGKK